MPGAIVHTVFWKWNGSQPADYISQLRTAAQGMVGAWFFCCALPCLCGCTEDDVWAPRSLLTGQIPGLKRVQMAPPLESTKARSQGWQTSPFRSFTLPYFCHDLACLTNGTWTVLYAEIESEEALKVYADHQAHLDFKKLTAPYSTGASFRTVPGLYWDRETRVLRADCSLVSHFTRRGHGV